MAEHIVGRGRTTTYQYDPIGRLSAIIAPNYNKIAFAYDAGGRPTEKWFPNGVTARMAYNADNSLGQVVNRTNAGILSQHVYTYDGVGNRKTQAETVGATLTNYAYGYDELNRLVQVANGVATAQENFTYHYHLHGDDPLGNRWVALGHTKKSVMAIPFLGTPPPGDHAV